MLAIPFKEVKAPVTRDEHGRLTKGSIGNPYGRAGKPRDPSLPPPEEKKKKTEVDVVTELEALYRTAKDRKEQLDILKLLLPYRAPKINAVETTQDNNKEIVISVPDMPTLDPNSDLLKLSSRSDKVE